VLYKELKLATFDPALAAALGFSPVAIHYGLMALVSATTVVAFDSVGAILVVAMLIVPAATAYLLTDRLPVMLGLAALSGSVSAVGGYWLARRVDGSIAGAMATVAGVLFLVAFLVGPQHGLVARALRLRRLRRRFARDLLLSHLQGHHGSAELGALRDRFLWTPRGAARVVGDARRVGLVAAGAAGGLTLTERGRAAAREVPVPGALAGDGDLSRGHDAVAPGRGG
jgi:manganese/zinc/iron transport system permease protein